jgi:hypothetical protein
MTDKTLPFYLVVFLAIGTSFFTVFNVPLLIDELGSWGLAQGSYSEVISQTLSGQGQGPLYFLLLSFWNKIFGESVTSMRGLSLLITLITLKLIVECGRILDSKDLGVRAALFFIITPCVFGCEFFARPYVLANFILCLIILCAIQFGRKGGNVFPFFGFCLSILLGFTHYLYCLAIPCTLGFVFLTSDSRHKTFRSIVWGLICACSILIVVATSLLARPEHFQKFNAMSYMASPSLVVFISDFVFTSSIGLVLLTLLILRLSIGLKHPRNGLDNVNKTIPIILFSVATVFFLYFALFVLSHVLNATLFLTRYYQIAALFGAFGVAAVDDWLKKPLMLRCIFIFLCSISGLDFLARNRNEGDTWFKTVSRIKETLPMECDLYVNTGFIELQDPSKIQDKYFQSFLRSPIKYYHNFDFQLLPISLTTSEANKYFREILLPQLAVKNCVMLVLSRIAFRKSDNTILRPLSEDIEKILREIGFINISRDVKFSDYDSFYLVTAKKYH